MKRGGWTTWIVGLAAFTSCGPRSATPPGTAANPARSWPGVSATVKLADDRIAVAQTVYVPINSSIATADNARPINLAVTLTVRNLDRGRSIVVGSIQYHDSGGKLVREFLDQPLRVGPLASMSLFVGESDNSGGPSPSFLVDWAADGDVVAPIAEAVMVTTAGSQGIALTSEGRVIADRRR